MSTIESVRNSLGAELAATRTETQRRMVSLMNNWEASTAINGNFFAKLGEESLDPSQDTRVLVLTHFFLTHNDSGETNGVGFVAACRNGFRQLVFKTGEGNELKAIELIQKMAREEKQGSGGLETAKGIPAKGSRGEHIELLLDINDLSTRNDFYDPEEPDEKTIADCLTQSIKVERDVIEELQTKITDQKRQIYLADRFGNLQ